MGQKLWGHVNALIPTLPDSMAEMEGVPVDDDRREQVQSGDPVMLPLGGSIPDFALPANAQGILECMVGLALVEADLSAALHISAEKPLYNKDFPFLFV